MAHTRFNEVAPAALGVMMTMLLRVVIQLMQGCLIMLLYK